MIPVAAGAFQPVDQTTGIRGLFSSAEAILGVIPAPASDVAARLQYLKTASATPLRRIA